ncbi:hypothetical protein M5K25_013593 [Dendrobium thyrsiflorum]|uniref:50S ribosomal protein L29 n=1 Tax=Dendrobium thyrsiflorum TaxID=117978 RepID=A0ABD0UU29_DENTH
MTTKNMDALKVKVEQIKSGMEEKFLTIEGRFSTMEGRIPRPNLRERRSDWRSLTRRVSFIKSHLVGLQ